jgi:hypothetical protein
MNEHYEAVLDDLKQMKADAEAGIAAIERLMVKGKPTEKRSSLWDDDEPAQQGPGLPSKVLDFLNANPSKSFRFDEIVAGIQATNEHSLRGALGRMVKVGRISKAGRGRFRARKPEASVTASAVPSASGR